ncbi:site-2 protease family protein [Candidatus Woesearchaeota archaeon]|nr:site-2 protease family protein [Candidatus Woesearchaeota archaeon]
MDYYKPIKIGFLNTSNKEIKDILKAWIVVAIAFTIVRTSSIFDIINKLLNIADLSLNGIILEFAITSITVGLGFLLHELAHKVVAQKYGCFAEFRSFDNMLILALIMSFFGFVFAAPGAVMISGYVNRERNGKISAAGPLTNLFLAILFLIIIFLAGGFLKELAAMGLFINSWLAFFNMIPVWELDGAKILRWNKVAYFGILSTAILLMLFVFLK